MQWESVPPHKHWLKAPSILLVLIPLVKKACLALIPDEAMVSMQPKVLIKGFPNAMSWHAAPTTT
jgi:hypothetical protein